MVGELRVVRANHRPSPCSSQERRLPLSQSAATTPSMALCTRTILCAFSTPSPSNRSRPSRVSGAVGQFGGQHPGHCGHPVCSLIAHVRCLACAPDTDPVLKPRQSMKIGLLDDPRSKMVGVRCECCIHKSPFSTPSLITNPTQTVLNGTTGCIQFYNADADRLETEHQGLARAMWLRAVFVLCGHPLLITSSCSPVVDRLYISRTQSAHVHPITVDHVAFTQVCSLLLLGAWPAPPASHRTFFVVRCHVMSCMVACAGRQVDGHGRVAARLSIDTGACAQVLAEQRAQRQVGDPCH